MPLGDAIIAAVVVALLGGLHCVGMCGPLSVIAARSTTGRLPYVLGKSGAYALLGLVAGVTGSVFAALLPVGRTLSLAVGSFLIVSGLVWVIFGGRPVRGPTWGKFTAVSGLTMISTVLSDAASSVIRTGKRGKSLALGAINGFFPCGLTMAALAIAISTSTAVGGALVMLAFGVATGPALLLAGVVYDHVAPERRVQWQRITGLVLIIAGVLTVARGMGGMDHGVHM